MTLNTPIPGCEPSPKEKARSMRFAVAIEDRIKSSQRLALWIQSQNGGNRDHLTRLISIRCAADGRYSGGELALGKHSRLAEIEGIFGGLILTQWENLFRMVYARSEKTAKSNNDFVGESLFAGPRDGSRIILLDDVKSATPLFENVAAAILETSSANFQHLYVADRDLMNEERHFATRWVRKIVGEISDPGALSGRQAHRWPGSVNLKPGRNRFWTKLVYLEDGKKIDVGSALKSGVKGGTVSARAATPQRDRGQVGEADKSASGQDWGVAIRMLQGGRSAAAVEEFLASSAQARGKGQAYVDTTMAALVAWGFLAGV